MYCSMFNSDGDPWVDFETMTCREAKVRRLSVTHATFHTMEALITRWAWYWEDQKGIWKQYRNLVRRDFILVYLLVDIVEDKKGESMDLQYNKNISHLHRLWFHNGTVFETLRCSINSVFMKNYKCIYKCLHFHACTHKAL